HNIFCSEGIFAVMTCKVMHLLRFLGRMAVAIASLLALGMAAAAAGDTITLRVAYGNPHAYTDMLREIVRRFEETHPSINVELLPASRDYEELVQQLLRSAAVSQPLPDVAFHGLHRVRLLVDRDLAVPLNPFIAAERDWPHLGYVPAMQKLGDQNGS